MSDTVPPSADKSRPAHWLERVRRLGTGEARSDAVADAFEQSALLLIALTHWERGSRRLPFERTMAELAPLLALRSDAVARAEPSLAWHHLVDSALWTLGGVLPPAGIGADAPLPDRVALSATTGSLSVELADALSEVSGLPEILIRTALDTHVPSHLHAPLLERLARVTSDESASPAPPGAVRPEADDAVLDDLRQPPDSAVDARTRTHRALYVRRGQQAFRQRLLEAYEHRCAISGSRVSALLEAAHISPWRGAHTDGVENGLLLRADLHTAFDRLLLGIDVERRVVLAGEAIGSEYERYAGTRIRLPADPRQHPSPEALAAHLKSVLEGPVEDPG